MLSWRSPCPYEHLTIFVTGNAFRLDEFGLHVFEKFIIKIKLALQSPIRHPPFTLQPGECVRHDFRKLHTPFSLLGRSLFAGRPPSGNRSPQASRSLSAAGFFPKGKSPHVYSRSIAAVQGAESSGVCEVVWCSGTFRYFIALLVIIIIKFLGKMMDHL